MLSISAGLTALPVPAMKKVRAGVRAREAGNPPVAISCIWLLTMAIIDVIKTCGFEKNRIGSPGTIFFSDKARTALEIECADSASINGEKVGVHSAIRISKLFGPERSDSSDWLPQ